jgi:AraC-like DNA-binding protein
MGVDSDDRAGLHPAYGLAVLADLLAELGVDAGPVFQPTGIDLSRLRDAQTRVAPAVELAAIRRAVAVAGVPDLGLRAGRRHHFGIFGMWGLAVVSSPDLAGAIRVGLRYIGLVHTFLTWNFREDPDDPRLEATEAHRFGQVRRFVLERDMAGAVTLLKDFAGDGLALVEARFPYPAPAWADAYRDVFGSRVVFGARRAALRVDPARLAQPLPRANPIAARLAEEQCRLLLTGQTPRAPVAERLRRALLARPGVFPPLPEAATACGLSERTLRRRLTAAGTSYRAELEAVRRELATRYLADTGLSLTETADRLGYRDASAFSHAFRRW